MSTAALLAVVALATVTACSSSDGPAFTGGDKSTPTAIPPSATAATGAPTATSGKDASASADVTIDSCTVDAATKIPKAELTVTNHGSDTATYTIRLEFVDGGGTRVAEGAAIANSLAANQQAKETADGTAQVTSDVTCKLAKVQRLAGM
ncbi:hypothetical protein GCM10015535_64490 [Streptomyces gelaticus]|uniref:Uncharacterized protein n=1 Tax=Streptomyces gelaticus TaxID=285446 RepID=A0ABQ2WA02_9ACTN|nr:hypothetical protein [Streptomyces gelaticus]GGV95938.1 hypothetical protein GCM10015535_64490 [Streptomyces gelaticus]